MLVFVLQCYQTMAGFKLLVGELAVGQGQKGSVTLCSLLVLMQRVVRRGIEEQGGW